MASDQPTAPPNTKFVMEGRPGKMSEGNTKEVDDDDAEDEVPDV